MGHQSPGALRISACLAMMLFLVQCAVSHAQIVAPRAAGPIALPMVVRPTLLTVTQASASAVPVKAVAPADTVALQSQLLNRFPLQQPMSLCYPKTVTYATNLLPASVAGHLATPVFLWMPTTAGLNYVVERAPVGTNAFTVVASTCANTAAVILLPSPAEVIAAPNAVFIDASGGFTPGATYVYVLSAYSASGQSQWMSFHWSAPSYSDMLQPPLQVALSHVGSTVTVATQFNSFWDPHLCPSGPPNCWQQYEQPDRTLITSSFGTSVAVPTAQTCSVSGGYVKYGPQYASFFNCQGQTGSPMGVQTFTVAAQWGWMWGRTYHVLAQSASASNQIDVEP